MISKKNKEALCVFHNYMCEMCKSLNKGKKLSLGKLEVHKINPKMGYSNHRNLKILCKYHHDIISSADRIARGIQ